MTRTTEAWDVGGLLTLGPRDKPVYAERTQLHSGGEGSVAVSQWALNGEVDGLAL